ncbi:hypothetical protein [Sphaerotilus sp.]|uniref:hypothetical protein n=1 Tax=Sphaerotilus sp. TaxID=2093942 RepID=UPI00286E4384|nr:hypothetical protein [Sphaerotilus sp.]
MHPNRPAFAHSLRRSRRTLTTLTASLLLGLGLLSTTAHAAPARDTLVMLVPDGANVTAWPVKVWTDSAAEEGIRLKTMTDTQFLALGATAAAQIAGLILPDSAHLQASDAVVAAVTQYANLGGKLMLVYDAGALTASGVYAPGKSRFSALAGVDYTLYDTLLDRMVGFGPVVSDAATLDNLSLPPGKSMIWTAPTTLARTTSTSTQFVQTTTTDPVGTKAMRSFIEARALRRADESSRNVRNAQTMTTQAVRDLLGLNSLPTTTSIRLAPKVTGTTTTSISTTTSTATTTRLAAAVATTPLKAISSYGYGYLDYFTFVTQGTYAGTPYLTSPDHGLVAGSRPVGSGNVLFVNLPLGYFKAIGTDSAPLHGFLNFFARQHVQMPTMSVQPKGVGGLVYNWHVDDGDDLTADAKFLLDTTTVFKRGPFSIHFTAGPDTVALGDGLGMHLDTSTASQAQFKRLKSLAVGHELASHGGWNHDLYGLGANETNASTYQPWLELNFAAVERQYGKKTTEYSAPQGNNPTWAVNWLDNRGVVGMYFVGDTGVGAIRSWRAGNRLSNKVWSFPLTPFEQYGTFEEFEEFGISDTMSGQWLLDLQTFVVNKRTNRMFYNHPPGARGHLPALTPLMTKADTLQAAGKFRWYTMTQLAQFSERRLATTWSAASNLGFSTFTVTHPTSLTDLTWLLPKSRYALPLVTAGKGTVTTTDTSDWIVTATSGTALKFTAAER